MSVEDDKEEELFFEGEHDGEPCYTKAEIFENGDVWLWQGPDEEDPGQDMVGISAEELHEIMKASDPTPDRARDRFRFVWIVNRTGYGLYMREPNGRVRPVYSTNGRSTFFFMDQVTSSDGDVMEVTPEFWPALFLASPMAGIEDEEERKEVKEGLWKELEEREKELLNGMYNGIFNSKEATRVFDTQVAIMLQYAKEYTKEHEDFDYERFQKEEQPTE